MATENILYDVIVVGAGIEGSATAYHLVKNGQKTMLLEQFPLPHSRGSSHGQSRITRKVYGSKDFYTVMMKEAFPLWEQLEKESGTKIFRQTGMLSIGYKGHPDTDFEGSQRSLQKHNIPFDLMDYKETKEKYPMISYNDNYSFILDHSGGILRADKALQVFQNQFQKYGGHLHDGEALIDLFPGDVITVRTNKGQYRTKNIVLTVGPWATKILPNLGIHLPLKPLRISVCYWKEANLGEFGADKFPVFSDHADEGDYHVYGLPSEEYPGHVKICLHYGPEIDPDNRDDVDDSWVMELVTKYVRNHFPGLIPTPSIKETCIYTWSPDEDFILDTHPAWKNIVIGAGFSGHGFKLSPVVGKILAELAMKKPPSYDLKPFRVDRFSPRPKL